MASILVFHHKTLNDLMPPDYSYFVLTSFMLGTFAWIYSSAFRHPLLLPMPLYVIPNLLSLAQLFHH